MKGGWVTDIPREAVAFCIWREGKSVRWDCTIRELAEAVGHSYSVVRSIVRERGWPVQDGVGRSLGLDRSDLTFFVQHQMARDRVGLRLTA